MTNETSDGLREAITKILRDDPVCCGRVSLATIGDIAALSHPAPAFGAAAAREAINLFLADYDDGDRAEAGNSALMEAHIADFRAAIRALPLPEAPASVEASLCIKCGYHGENTWFHYPIMMPLNANGEGPATIGVDATTVAFEVWDQHCDSFGRFEHLCDALKEAVRLNAALTAPAPTSKTVDDSAEAVGCQQEAVAVDILRDMVRLSEMGYEQSMLEPEENGNYVTFNRAKAFLAGHLPTITIADALRDIPDEIYRHIVDSQDIGHARSRVADLVVRLPIFSAHPAPQAQGAEGPTRQQLLDTISDPVAVHANMLRGAIAKPSVASMIHIYGADAVRAALPEIDTVATLTERSEP